MKNQELKAEIRKAKVVTADNLAWDKRIEDKLVHAGINKNNIGTFINAAIDEKLAWRCNKKVEDG